MDSLANIFDEPVVEVVSEPAQPVDVHSDKEAAISRPHKRPKSTLFLSDSEDESQAPGPSRFATRDAPPPDIDALFADIDDDDLQLAPLPARIDEEAAAREAEARHRRNISSSAPPSSPSRDNADSTKETNGKDDVDKKARRKQLKLDENRLLGPNGFPQLIKMTKDFRIKGKGHEATDLNRLLQTYQFWTHQLYPKTQFRDTAERVEKLTHSRRMNVALSVWRDEALGISKTHGNSENEDDEDILENGDHLESEQTTANEHLPSSGSSPIQSSRASSPPPTSGAESDTPMRPPVEISKPLPQSAVEDDDEAFWQSMDDFAMESFDVHAPPPAPATRTATADEDAEMWDMIDEIEKSGEANTSVHTAPAVHGHEPDDWDDMYL